jgi:hypothetical protein
MNPKLCSFIDFVVARLWSGCAASYCVCRTSLGFCPLELNSREARVIHHEGAASSELIAIKAISKSGAMHFLHRRL